MVERGLRLLTFCGRCVCVDSIEMTSRKKRNGRAARRASGLERANKKKRLPGFAIKECPPGIRPLSQELSILISAVEERSVTLHEVITVLQARAYTLLLIFLALPFCTPVPLPGVSTPFGLVIALIGFRLMLMQKPWLPARLLNTRVPARFFGRLLAAARKIIRAMELLLKPRLCVLLDLPALQALYGGVICVCGFLLLLPLPVPFSNLFPALTIVLFAAAILERDGYFVIIGSIVFAMTLIFYSVLAWGGTEMVQWINRWLLDRFAHGA